VIPSHVTMQSMNLLLVLSICVDSRPASNVEDVPSDETSNVMAVSAP
jgi:hypothetical protein